MGPFNEERIRSVASTLALRIHSDYDVKEAHPASRMLATPFTESLPEHFSKVCSKYLPVCVVFGVRKCWQLLLYPIPKLLTWLLKKIGHAETQRGNMHDIIVGVKCVLTKKN